MDTPDTTPGYLNLDSVNESLPLPPDIVISDILTNQEQSTEDQLLDQDKPGVPPPTHSVTQDDIHKIMSGTVHRSHDSGTQSPHKPDRSHDMTDSTNKKTVRIDVSSPVDRQTDGQTNEWIIDRQTDKN